MYENRKLSLSYSKLLKLLYHIHHCVESKSILIFLSGWFMISSVYNLLKKDGLFGSNAYEVLRLHSHQPTQSISQIFDDVPLNIRRIILSTNIAESSITVNGVGVVIDTCTTRLFKSFDGLSIPSFITTWASKSQLEQRKGRTGRTMKGICYRFLSRLVYNRLPSFHSAALHSANIEDMYLKLKFLKLVNPSKIFNNLIEPPSSIAISNAIDALKQLNALDTVGELTNVGSFMGYFPLPPVLSKLVLIGYFLGISRPMATIVATLESREPYAKQTIFSDFIQEHKNKLCDGDHWLMYNFVKYFEQKK
ncbi:hypothetical protein GJ496_012061 [Pomphorhynchus laevis]|nr:hypothetical protein GJ496_012061 [Pomphorhynchus laevis]